MSTVQDNEILVKMYGYEFQEYEKLMEQLSKVSGEVTRFKKGDDRLTSEHIEKKLGTKSEMAGLIIRLTSACLGSMKTLEKLNKHNFDLRGKVVDLSTVALDATRTDFSNTQNELKKEIANLKEQVVRSTDDKEKKTYAGIVGGSHNENYGDSQFLVEPIRKAMQQVKTDDFRMRNVIVHGLDVNPDIPKEDLIEHVKEMANNVVNEIDEELLYEDPEEFTVLGKVRTSGKAPPVLVRMKDERQAKLVLNFAHKLSKLPQLRGVYITPDMDKKEREKRRELKDLLKKKISEFPQQHWVIRLGTVTSIGKHSPIDKSQLSERLQEDRSLDRSFNY